METYRLHNVFEGFRETVRFPKGCKVLDEPQGILSCIRLTESLVFQRSPTFPLQIQDAAGKDSLRKKGKLRKPIAVSYTHLTLPTNSRV